MAEKEHGRLRPTFAELLSPSAVLQTARGTLTDHDEPVVGGSVKGDAGQDYHPAARRRTYSVLVLSYVVRT